MPSERPASTDAPPSIKPAILITSGPTYEPIDEVRRLTNFSTGRSGSLLATALSHAGYQVTMLRGRGSSAPAPEKPVETLEFTTRDSLKELLQVAARGCDYAAVLHLAAIGDFEVNAILDKDNQPVTGKKISGSTAELKIHLKPAPKLIKNFRSWFPDSILVGWKYELEGKRDQALQRGWRQLQDYGTDACVVNGLAYGEGFGFCTPPQQHAHLHDLQALNTHLAGWLDNLLADKQPS